MQESKIPVIDKTKIYIVNKEKAPQSEIRIGYMAMPFDALGDYHKSGIMNYVLGGAFNSRINLNLRELHGYTYGASSAFSGNKFTGPFLARSAVKSNATDSSIVEFIKEIKNYADKGITNEELTFTKNSISQNEALRYETSSQKAGFIKRIWDYNLNKNFVAKQSELLKSITKKDIDILSKKYLPYNAMAIVVVGDIVKIYDGLKKLNFEIIELDTDGNLIKESGKIILEKPKKEEEQKNEVNTEPIKKLPAEGKKKAKFTINTQSK